MKFRNVLSSYFQPTYEWIPTVKNPTLDSSINSLTFEYAGRLLLRHEISIDESHFQQLLSNQYFQEINPFDRLPRGYRCRRCGNKASHLFSTFPCSVCEEEHHYCRSCIEMGRVSDCEKLYMWTGPDPNWAEIEKPCQWNGELTAAQSGASERFIEAIREKQELLLWAVCGSGKTEMVFPGIGFALEQGLRVCLATPRVDVVRELLPRFQAAFPNVSIAALYGGSTDKNLASPLVLATTHQLLRYANAFDVMIIDEVDAFPFHHSKTLPYATNRAVKPTSTTVYLTATPRKDLKRRMTRKELDTVFVPTRYHGHPLPVPSMRMCWDLKKARSIHSPPKAFFQWFTRRKNPNRQLLIFVPTIEIAERLRNTLQTKDNFMNQKIESVYSSDPEREEKVEHFRNKEYNIMITTTILERGVTFPSVDVTILDAGHEVFDEAALVQIAGRAGRNANDPDGEVVFYHDGRTEAMVKAIQSIKEMNKRGGFK
ncbi:DEAD/DEAH box helicase [Radiobacillus kanasensis]|uniref:DEAD/DEAH box helicase n=1 Tax=Radiobacillus kanasensis TaxID=2844358 RepID=UPI001E364E09|nr:DEAD/DEAH box helicase [Radiobacillus kanasensis]UFT98558.1 DEAD/DEAH box helicase [Radiobacillus kanasensis]